MTPKTQIIGKMSPGYYSYIGFSVFDEFKEIFHKFHSYKTICTLRYLKKKASFALSIYGVGIIIIVNLMTDL